jgi:hypothetical protein
MTEDVQDTLMFRSFQGQAMISASACAERWTANSSVSSGSSVAYPLVQQALQSDYMVIEQVCSLISQQDFNPPAAQALSSNLPMLVLHGAYNAAFSPELVEDWLRGFSQAQLVILSGQGNGMFGGGSCATRIISEFLEEPIREVDATCVQENPLEFFFAPN